MSLAPRLLAESSYLSLKCLCPEDLDLYLRKFRDLYLCSLWPVWKANPKLPRSWGYYGTIRKIPMYKYAIRIVGALLHLFLEFEVHHEYLSSVQCWTKFSILDIPTSLGKKVKWVMKVNKIEQSEYAVFINVINIQVPGEVCEVSNNVVQYSCKMC